MALLIDSMNGICAPDAEGAPELVFETTIWSTVCQVEAAKLSHALVPIGRLIANTQIYI
ncbi:MAG: hypothetical protein KME30_25560 [Iphinoe sp. HA4291-MV1]|nr:hypothetical protein [Iphinoe sp. HA4291-MV1]